MAVAWTKAMASPLSLGSERDGLQCLSVSMLTPVVVPALGPPGSLWRWELTSPSHRLTSTEPLLTH